MTTNSSTSHSSDTLQVPLPTEEANRSSRSIRIAGLVLLILAPVTNVMSGFIEPVDERGGGIPETFIDAAGYAFSIWSVIFLGMIGYGVFQVNKKRVESTYLRRASWGVLLAALALNLFVPVTFLGSSFLVFLTILLHLIPLIVAYQALRKQYALETSSKTKWAYAPVSIFMGWISAATVITATQTLIEAGVSVSNAVAKGCAIVLIVVLVGLAGFFQRKKDGLFVLTVVWALVGVAVEQWREPPVGYAALAGAIVAFLFFVSLLRYGQRGLLPDPQ